MQKKPHYISIAEVFLNQISRAIEHRAPEIQDGLDRMNKWLENHRPAVQKGVEFLQNINKIDWDEAIRRLNAIPDLSKKSMIFLLSKGWFFGWYDSLSDLLTLIEKLDSIAPKDVDELMAKYYRNNIDSVELKLIQRYPKRSEAISAAFMAHKNLGDVGYFLSIPVFIAQADGLLSEILKIESPLSTHKPTKEMKAMLALRPALDSDQELSDLLHPFLIMLDSDLLKSKSKRDKEMIQTGEAFIGLNRHQVMHGECSNYGSEINSLKAFSFLAFIGLHLPMMLEDKNITIPKT
ncbi:hypothetical protein [Janthinobacterium sp. GMG1]|uniref:hypothetical protein n=1 Tax=Janthinobacterium sp. GMG1 TaxID=3096007 RepID=UPI002ACA6025|nr:hypothetical protein [Janthinobacterium sp. GMG1]MDZ5633919.1 hypothetical protein [Janthinobacterium sp. GMG1]